MVVGLRAIRFPSAKLDCPRETHQIRATTTIMTHNYQLLELRFVSSTRSVRTKYAFLLLIKLARNVALTAVGERDPDRMLTFLPIYMNWLVWYYKHSRLQSTSS